VDNPNQYDIHELAVKLANGTISEDERAYFEKWYASFQDEEVRLSATRYTDEEALKQAIFTAINGRIAVPGRATRRGSLRRIYRMVAAACAGILLATGGYLFWHREPVPAAQVSKVHEIVPGSNKAVLTLSNGSKIILDSARNGQLASQGSSSITKIDSGLLVYQPESRSQTPGQALAYNTLTTPRGGQYKLILPDGTKVWLNAASSIRYPTAFSGKQRSVRITGEVYFEIAEEAKRPFTVLTDKMAIAVLGTHFNVKAYPDESESEVTLLEGAVKVSKGDKNILLKPGEQARLSGDNQLNKVGDVNLQGVVAWTNNQFWFDGADIGTVMQQISRWYNVAFEIEGDIPQHFTGYIPRNVGVKKMFDVLEKTNLVHFSIKDNKIIVSP